MPYTKRITARHQLLSTAINSQKSFNRKRTTPDDKSAPHPPNSYAPRMWFNRTVYTIAIKYLEKLFAKKKILLKFLVHLWHYFRVIFFVFCICILLLLALLNCKYCFHTLACVYESNFRIHPVQCNYKNLHTNVTMHGYGQRAAFSILRTANNPLFFCSPLRHSHAIIIWKNKTEHTMQ